MEHGGGWAGGRGIKDLLWALWGLLYKALGPERTTCSMKVVHGPVGQIGNRPIPNQGHVA